MYIILTAQPGYRAMMQQAEIKMLISEILLYITGLLFALCYAYQFVFIPIVWFKKDRPAPATDKSHSFAVLICARDEEAVIGDLIDCVNAQDYPREKIRSFVIADNCTDATAAVASQHGAIVYTRNDTEHIGKGYALDALLRHIAEDYPAGFDGYFVFDADNLIPRDYIEKMDRVFSVGSDIVTGYRNSKNYSQNWVSSGYAIWFMRESSFLNYPRRLISSSATVEGTGFLFSRAVLDELGGWPFHLLTEDVEFTAHEIISGRKIAYCPEAEIFDEQPVSFKSSCRQRLRWCRGYFQVFRKYGAALLRGSLRGSFSCFDMMMSITPAFILAPLYIVLCALSLALHAAMTAPYTPAGLAALLCFPAVVFFMLFLIGTGTTFSERKRIRATAWQKLLYCLTFPFFMLTFAPIALLSYFVTPKWTPMKHTVSMDKLNNDEFGL